MVSIAMVTIRRFSSQAESTGRHPALCCLWCIHSDRPLSGGAFLCRIHHSFWNLGYYSISQGAIFSDVMKACQQAGRIGNDPVEKTLTQIPVLSYRETGIT